MKYHSFHFIMTLVVCSIITLQSRDSLQYISPVNHQIRLTGNFMEIRNNHFHSGIDIKSSNGRSGDVIKSVHDGYISRIKIQSGSYGNALYIDHPSTGHTSVYAHLDVFNEEIEAFVRKVQYDLESFEVDIYLPDSLMTVVQGQEIGRMGNTGRSFGPHLHFELRDTRTEEPLNPEMLGLGPTDNRAPVIENLTLYEISDEQSVIGKSVKYFKRKGPEYELYQSNLTVSSSHVAFGLHMHDYMDGSYNKNGVYGYRVFVNDTLNFQWEANRYNFNENRLLNGFIDYQRKKELGHKVYLLYRQPCNDFAGYQGNGSGIVSLESGTAKIRLQVYDLYNNQASVEFYVSKGETTFVSPKKPDLVSCTRDHTISTDNFTVGIDSSDLFESMNIRYNEFEYRRNSTLYPAISIGNTNFAPKSYYTISINNSDYRSNNKWTLVHINTNGKLQDFGLTYDTLNNRLYGQVDVFGQFCLYKDDNPPDIELVNIDPTFKRPWVFRIKDDLVPDGQLPDLFYRAEINGRWVRLKYDLKSDRLIFEDFDRIPDGPFEFKLLVVDNCGNKSLWRRMFKNV